MGVRKRSRNWPLTSLQTCTIQRNFKKKKKISVSPWNTKRNWNPALFSQEMIFALCGFGCNVDETAESWSETNATLEIGVSGKSGFVWPFPRKQRLSYTFVRPYPPQHNSRLIFHWRGLWLFCESDSKGLPEGANVSFGKFTSQKFACRELKSAKKSFWDQLLT